MKKTYTLLALALVAIVVSMFTCTSAKTHAQGRGPAYEDERWKVAFNQIVPAGKCWAVLPGGREGWVRCTTAERKKQELSERAHIQKLWEAKYGASQDVAKSNPPGTPKANAGPTTPTPEVKLPPVVALTAEESTRVIDATKDATITDLQAQNLKLQIEKAQLQLKELNEATQKKVDARNAIWQAALERAGVPKDKIDLYESVDPLPGSNIITFKLKAAPKN